MISPETLRKYVFFGFLADDEFAKLAVFAEEKNWQTGEVIFSIDQDAGMIYLLEKGSVDLHYKVVDDLVSDKSKEFYVGDIDPGEPFGVSALLAPFQYTASAVAATESSGIAIDAKKLLALANDNPKLGFALMSQLAKSIFEQLGQARVELVAAR